MSIFDEYKDDKIVKTKPKPVKAEVRAIEQADLSIEPYIAGDYFTSSPRFRRYSAKRKKAYTTYKDIPNDKQADYITKSNIAIRYDITNYRFYDLLKKGEIPWTFDPDSGISLYSASKIKDLVDGINGLSNTTVDDANVPSLLVSVTHANVKTIRAMAKNSGVDLKQAVNTTLATAYTPDLALQNFKDMHNLFQLQCESYQIALRAMRESQEGWQNYIEQYIRMVAFRDYLVNLEQVQLDDIKVRINEALERAKDKVNFTAKDPVLKREWAKYSNGEVYARIINRVVDLYISA